jgi:hypothetical protein
MLGEGYTFMPQALQQRRPPLPTRSRYLASPGSETPQVAEGAGPQSPADALAVAFPDDAAAPVGNQKGDEAAASGAPRAAAATRGEAAESSDDNGGGRGAEEDEHREAGPGTGGQQEQQQQQRQQQQAGKAEEERMPQETWLPEGPASPPGASPTVEPRREQVDQPSFATTAELAVVVDASAGMTAGRAGEGEDEGRPGGGAQQASTTSSSIGTPSDKEGETEGQGEEGGEGRLPPLRRGPSVAELLAQEELLPEEPFDIEQEHSGPIHFT